MCRYKCTHWLKTFVFVIIVEVIVVLDSGYLKTLIAASYYIDLQTLQSWARGLPGTRP